MTSTQEYICTCGHSHENHFAPGMKCLGSRECRCQMSRNTILAEGREKTIAQQRQTIDALMTALKQFSDFADAWDRMPLRGISDRLYSIHSGTEYAAHLSLSDFKTARDVLAKARGESNDV